MQYLYKLGHTSDATLATERVLWSAQESGDRLRALAAHWYDAGESRAGREGQRRVRRGRSRLGPGSVVVDGDAEEQPGQMPRRRGPAALRSAGGGCSNAWCFNV